MAEICVTAASDSSLLVTLGDLIELCVHRRVRSLCALLEEAPHPAIVNLSPAYASVLITFDPRETSLNEITTYTESLLPSIDACHTVAARLIEIPVCYGEEFGPDLGAVAAYTGLSMDEVVRIHSCAEYVVYFLGFSPGFPYLGGMPDSIATPRLAQPVRSIPAGSVAIGGAQTGIYPVASPGGWRVIGRTPLRLFNADAESPALLAMGDCVRFVPVTRQEYLQACR
jgi:inhibitor of KinA